MTNLDDTIKHLENYSSMLKAQANFIDSQIVLMKQGQDLVNLMDQFNIIKMFGNLNGKN